MSFIEDMKIGQDITTEYGQATKLQTKNGVVVVVSTVYIGHGKGNEYETKVFLEPCSELPLNDIETHRYGTTGEALDGHLAVVKEWKEKVYSQ